MLLGAMLVAVRVLKVPYFNVASLLQWAVTTVMLRVYGALVRIAVTKDTAEFKFVIIKSLCIYMYFVSCFPAEYYIKLLMFCP